MLMTRIRATGCSALAILCHPLQVRLNPYLTLHFHKLISMIDSSSLSPQPESLSVLGPEGSEDSLILGPGVAAATPAATCCQHLARHCCNTVTGKKLIPHWDESSSPSETTEKVYNLLARGHSDHGLAGPG